ncbi:MAG: ankyrin repeat domain-containing protein [Holosporaceae bacterium]|jgi:ankyrin repeat protein|nr:ankyrin repeat domain-containing protein [Holosporaceae bacterium]
MEKNRYSTLLKMLFSAVFILSTVDQSSSMRRDQVAALRLNVNLAIESGDVEGVKYWAARGAKIKKIVNRGENTPLHGVAYSGDERMAQVLIDNGAEVNRKNDEGYSSLHIAVMREHTNVVVILLDNKANIDEQGNAGNSPLHIAAMHGRRNVVEILLDRGANIDLQDNDGFTAAHWAVIFEEREIVEILRARGANFTIKSAAGQTPSDIAEKGLRESSGE